MQDEHAACCLLWEPCIPRPLQAELSFLVAPKFSEKSSSTISQEEIAVDRTQIQPLLDFELLNDAMIPADQKDRVAKIPLWKDRGDQLLRLGDPTSAIPYYELALHLSSVLSIGSSVICSVQGFPKVAEVDCTEANAVDVVYVESGDEATIPQSDVLIVILEEGENKEHWQERILLNLARCLLQQADIDTPRRAKYLKSAVLACTLVLSIASFHDHESGNSSDTSQTALQLRIKAQMGLSKWPHATADCKQLLKLGKSTQGQKLLDQIEREKKLQAKRDKKLVKAVSQLVQNATSESVSDNDSKVSQQNERNVGGDGRVLDRDASAGPPRARKGFVSLSSPHVILLVIAAAFLIQKLLFN